MSAGQSRGLDYRNGTLGAELLRRFNVRKGSPAEDAGLRRGDEIEYINNKTSQKQFQANDPAVIFN